MTGCLPRQLAPLPRGFLSWGCPFPEATYLLDKTPNLAGHIRVTWSWWASGVLKTYKLLCCTQPSFIRTLGWDPEIWTFSVLLEMAVMNDFSGTTRAMSEKPVTLWFFGLHFTYNSFFYKQWMNTWVSEQVPGFVCWRLVVSGWMGRVQQRHHWLVLSWRTCGPLMPAQKKQAMSEYVQWEEGIT